MRKGRILKILFPGLLFLSFCFEFALAESNGPEPGLDGFEILDTLGTSVPFNEIRTGSREKEFISHGKGRFRFGIIDHQIWIRAKVPAFDRNGLKPVLVINSPGIKQADLFFPVQDGSKIRYERLAGGLSEVTSLLDWQYRFMVYELPHSPASGQWLYFGFNSGGHTANFTISLADPGKMRRISWMEITIFSLCFGVLVGMILYNTFLYLFLWDRNHLIYVVYILGMFAYQICHSGMGRMAGMPLLINASIPISTLTYIFGLAFAQQFLNTREHLKVFHKLMVVLMAVSGMALILSLSGQVRTANQITHILGVLIPIIMIITGVLRIRQGFLPARYYLAAWLILMFSIIVLVLVGLRLIPYNFVTYNAHVLGSAVESILLSMALGDRMRMIRRERQKLQEHRRRLSRLSITDDLTGLLNKRGYVTKLASEVKQARDDGAELSLMVLDIDHFKSFNDTHGHVAGDRMLAALGEIISRSTREIDIPCRFGGEEFAVILPGIAQKEAFLIAERLRKNVEENGSVHQAENGTEAWLVCTISIGVSSLIPDDSETSLFERADAALYRAKAEGRNLVVCSPDGHTG